MSVFNKLYLTETEVRLQQFSYIQLQKRFHLDDAARMMHECTRIPTMDFVWIAEFTNMTSFVLEIVTVQEDIIINPFSFEQ